MSVPLITIAIPTFNRAAMLGDALRSCLAQTIGDFEVVISDNCSSVPPTSVVAGFADERLRLFRTPHPVTPTKNWNNCLAQARGRYITYLCDDDALLPNYLEDLLALIQSAPGCALATAPWAYADQSLRSEGFRAWTGEVGQYHPLLLPLDFMLHVLWMRRNLTLDGTLCETATLRAVGGFVTPCGLDPWWADHFAWFRVAMTGSVVRSTATPLFLYRCHDSNICITTDYSRLSAELDGYRARLTELGADAESLPAALDFFCGWYRKRGAIAAKRREAAACARP